MRLQKQLSRKVGKKHYAKYVTVIPPKIVKEARLKGGDELDIGIKNGKIVISLKKNSS